MSESPVTQFSEIEQGMMEAMCRAFGESAKMVTGRDVRFCIVFMPPSSSEPVMSTLVTNINKASLPDMFDALKGKLNSEGPLANFTPQADQRPN